MSATFGNLAMKELQKQSGLFLSEDPAKAAEELIKHTRKLIYITERESKAICDKDFAGLGELQNDKAALAAEYALISAQFRERKEEFRGLNSSLLHRLEAAQKDLSDKSRTNMALLEKEFENQEEQKTGGAKARKATANPAPASVLLAAQEVLQSSAK